uniref:CID domain-containing protein n=1 Tax=Kalanchoe fedtschenkoi TaxID=63787 RepID=A0A7N0UPZ9_KALFE
MNSVFSEQVLADKLSKLNNTQQCIETLSHWCIFHQSKAELVVSTWVKEFKNSDMAQKVPLLYLANDILQNSKRKGTEFVTEFWKVLPDALKELEEKGDERGKRAVSRLCDIWEERKVFGSRSRSIRELMLGGEAPPPLEFSRRRSRSVRLLRKDSRSIKMKLSIGGAPEKIASAYYSVLSEHLDEDDDMDKCKAAINSVKKMERDIEMACASVKDPKRKSLAKQLEENENHLKNGIEKLKYAEANRAALVEQLKEALNEEESELENIRTQMQVAEALIVEAGTWRKRLTDDNYVAVPRVSMKESTAADANSKTEQGSKKTAAAIAAEVADKLAASTSSQYIMSSVLSTFAAEEAKSAGLAKISSSNSFPPMPMIPGNANGLPNHNSGATPDQKMYMGTQTFTGQQNHSPVSTSDQNIYGATQTQTFVGQQNNPYQSVYVSQPVIQTAAPNSQAQYHLIAQAPPPQQQFMPPAGGVLAQYGYGNVPPMQQGQPPAHHMVSPMMQMQQPPLQQQQFIPVAPQPPPPPSFRPIQSPGMAYYAQPHYNQ